MSLIRSVRAQISGLASILLAAAGPASGSPLPDRERAAFVETHRCAVIERLRSIHLRGPRSSSRNRFLIVGDAREPQNYVQCIFFDEDARMHCEASSTAYGPRSEVLRPEMSRASAEALRRLGFSQADPNENYVREITLDTPPDFQVAAVLMLGALHDAYGASSRTRLTFTAPMAVLDHRVCPGPVAWK